jgi:hypothetical protein
MPGMACGSRSMGNRVGVRAVASLPPRFEQLDDDHASAAARAWRAEVSRFFRNVVIGRRRDAQQSAREREAGLAGAAGEEAVVPDAMEAVRQDMEQEDPMTGGG